MYTRLAFVSFTLAAGALFSGPAQALSVVGTPICLGDGSGSACPCGNTGQLGAGCASSLGFGAVLSAANTSGIASVWADIGRSDPVILTVTSLPPNGACLFFQGTPTAPVLFGDGLRCLGAPSLVKLGVKFASSAGVASYPGFGDNPLALQSWVNFPVEVPGARGYQVWYRDPLPPFCTPSAANLSSGVFTYWY